MIIADIRPLRVSRHYRRLWFGITASQLGQQMTSVAVAIQVYALTRSNFAVGLVGLVVLGPMVVGGLYGGAIADVMDRRLLAIAASSGLAVTSLVLAGQAYADLRQLWLIYAVVALQGLFFAVNNPTRNAMIPRLLPVELLTAANALAQLSSQLGLTVGPLLAGILISWLGLGAAYTVDVVTFGAALYALVRLPPIPPIDRVQRAGLASVIEGLRFLRTRPAVLMTFLTDLCAMVLAWPRALFPALAANVYGGGSKTVGVLSAAPAFGAVASALLSGWTSVIRRQGLAVLLAVSVWGLAIVGFGLSAWLPMAVLFLALAGAADLISAIFRNTILQVATPDELRGRLQGVFIVVVAGGPRLGDFTAGTVASLRTEMFAAVTGGLLCVTLVWLLAARYRGFLSYDARNPTP